MGTGGVDLSGHVVDAMALMISFSAMRAHALALLGGGSGEVCGGGAVGVEVARTRPTTSTGPLFRTPH